MEEDNNLIWEESSKVLELIRRQIDSIYDVYFYEMSEEDQIKIEKIFNILNN